MNSGENNTNTNKNASVPVTQQSDTRSISTLPTSQSTLPPVPQSILPPQSSQALIPQSHTSAVALRPVPLNPTTQSLSATSHPPPRPISFTLASFASYPHSFVPFRRIRNYMREEAKKAGLTIQYRKESVTVLKEICDQFMRELMRIILVVCDQRETKRYDIGLGGQTAGTNRRSGEDSVNQEHRATTEGQNKRKWTDDGEEVQKKHRSDPRSLSAPSSATKTETETSTKNNNIRPSNALTRIRQNKFAITPKEPNRFKETMNNESMNKPKHSDTSFSELVEQTNKLFRTIKPEDIVQALRHMNLEQLLEYDPYKELETWTTMSEPSVDMNNFFIT